MRNVNFVEPIKFRVLSFKIAKRTVDNQMLQVLTSIFSCDKYVHKEVMSVNLDNTNYKVEIGLLKGFFFK